MKRERTNITSEVMVKKNVLSRFSVYVVPNLDYSFLYKGHHHLLRYESLNPLQKTKQQVHKYVKYINFVKKKRRHGNFKGECSLYVCKLLKLSRGI